MCSSGQYQDEVSKTKCKDCGIGEESGEGAAACQSCPAGKAGTPCELCLAGYYRPLVDENGAEVSAQSCLMCDKGKYQNSRGQAQCLICVPGKFNNELGLKTQCKLCDHGKFSNETELTACFDCAIGKSTNSQKGSASCTTCAAGRFGKGGRSSKNGTRCTACRAGMFRVGTGDGSTCDICPQGYFQNIEGSAFCLSCLPGKYGGSSGLVTCQDCAENTAQPEANASECLPCSSGRTASGGSASCAKCNGGEFGGSETGSTTCAKCPGGWYRNGADDDPSRCLQCKLGETSIDGAAECQNCDTGRSGEVPGKCSDCGPGPLSYQDTRGQTDCKVCGIGKQANSKRTACERPNFVIASDCKTTDYLYDLGSDSEHECKPCPVGANCTRINDQQPSLSAGLQPLQDYRNSSWLPEGVFFAKCPFAGACVNGNCTKAYESDDRIAPLCSVCSPGYTMGTGGCRECSTAQMASRLGSFIGFMLVISFVVSYFRKRIIQVWRRYGAQWRNMLMIFTIQVSFLQIGAALPDLIPVDFPQAYLFWTDLLAPMQFDVLSILGATCIEGMTYEFKFLSTVSVVIAILCFMFLSYCWKIRSIPSNQVARAAVSELSRKELASSLFQTVDADHSGEIDAGELSLILAYLPVNRQNENADQMLDRLGAFNGKLCRANFVEAVVDGRLSGGARGVERASGMSWVRHIQFDMARSSHISAAVQMLLLWYVFLSFPCVAVRYR